jgi:hypothetical protein
MFDPYFKWLGIPEVWRPPTHYQLLGISPDEHDPKVIEEAVISQTSLVRVFQLGPYCQECTRVLNEIAVARTVLLNPVKRRDYDASLARKAAEPKAPPTVRVPIPRSEFPAHDVLFSRADPLTAPRRLYFCCKSRVS